ADAIQAAGLPAFKADLATLLPDFVDRLDEIRTWEDVKLLSVRSDRLARWYRPGYLAIGDAAPAMSPVGGGGLNLAVPAAAAAATLPGRPPARGRLSTRALAAAQRRREWPVRVVQAAQTAAQRIAFRQLGAGAVRTPPPRLFGLVARLPLLRDLPARLIGFGV